MKTVTPKQLPGILRKVGKQGFAAVRRGMFSGANRSVTVLQQKTTDAGVFDRGIYRRGWAARATTRGVQVYNSAPHSPVIEWGRRAGAKMPPLAVIAQWARRKVRIDTAGGKQRKLKVIEAGDAAFPIARAIAKRGIPGKHILRDTTPQLNALIVQEVVRELQKTIRGFTP